MISFYHLSGAYCMNFTDASVFSLTGFPIRSSLAMCSRGFYFVSHLNLAAFLLYGAIHIPWNAQLSPDFFPSFSDSFEHSWYF